MVSTGDDIIKDFAVGTDAIDLETFAMIRAQVHAAMTTDGNDDAVITLVADTAREGTFTLTGAGVGELSASDCVL